MGRNRFKLVAGLLVTTALVGLLAIGTGKQQGVNNHLPTGGYSYNPGDKVTVNMPLGRQEFTVAKYIPASGKSDEPAKKAPDLCKIIQTREKVADKLKGVGRAVERAERALDRFD